MLPERLGVAVPVGLVVAERVALALGDSLCVELGVRVGEHAVFFAASLTPPHVSWALKVAPLSLDAKTSYAAPSEPFSGTFVADISFQVNAESE